MFDAAFREIGISIRVVTYYEFMKNDNSYKYILVDEVQDLVPSVIETLERKSEHLIVAGDSNQSIYERDPRWNERTVEPSKIGTLIQGNEFELNIIHRLSRSIIDAIQRLMPSMNIFNSKRDMTKKDIQIRICEAQSYDQEVSYIMENATKAANRGYTCGVLIYSQNKILEFANAALRNAGKKEWKKELNRYNKPDYDKLNSHLDQNKIPLQYVGNGYGSFNENSHKITLMTYHSAKGLDFDNVYIPFANKSMYIYSNESLAKTLFMVAMTRSRENLYITYNGYTSDYLDVFISNCSKININNTDSQTNNSDNPFGF
jgi:superfamily I DNA/RNA helicase